VNEEGLYIKGVSSRKGLQKKEKKTVRVLGIRLFELVTVLRKAGRKRGFLPKSLCSPTSTYNGKTEEGGQIVTLGRAF